MEQVGRPLRIDEEMANRKEGETKRIGEREDEGAQENWDSEPLIRIIAFKPYVVCTLI